jgi:hypothetical protein
MSLLELHIFNSTRREKPSRLVVSTLTAWKSREWLQSCDKLVMTNNYVGITIATLRKRPSTLAT